MGAVELTSADGSTSFTANLPASKPGVARIFLFAYFKSGSTLLNDLIFSYCEAQDIPTFSLFDAAFNAGVATSNIAPEAARCFDNPGVVYGGFRHFPSFVLDVSDAKVILLVRDPRDILVSLYFSVRFSHQIPEEHQSMAAQRQRAAMQDINHFVIHNAESVLKAFRSYQKNLADQGVQVYRYEDVVFNKLEWLRDMLVYLELEIDESLMRDVVSRFDLFPKQEDAQQHIRQVAPRDYARKLDIKTINDLNSIFEPYMNTYNYAV